MYLCNQATDGKICDQCHLKWRELKSLPLESAMEQYSTLLPLLLNVILKALAGLIGQENIKWIQLKQISSICRRVICRDVNLCIYKHIYVYMYIYIYIEVYGICVCMRCQIFNQKISENNSFSKVVKHKINFQNR